MNRNLAKPQASSRGDISPFIVMDVMRSAARLEAAGHDVAHLEVGEPGAAPPRVVIEAAERALRAGRIGYTLALGIAPLRERIARHYAERHGVSVSPERVVVTTGSSAGFVLAFLALFDPGARVAMPSPTYPCYRNILKALGVAPVAIETGEATRWALSADMLETGGPFDGVLVASPANPSGTLTRADALRSLADWCASAGAWFVSDEIYHGLTYDEPAETALRFSDDAVVINSFSKYFCMTGWRIGWMVVPEHLVRTVERLAQNLYISAPTISQHAALAAFDAGDELEAVRQVYAGNRALLRDALPGLGLGHVLPMDGAFYAYVDVSRFTDDSMDFARRILEEARVAVTPGLDFDEARGGKFLRLSYAGTREDIEKAIDRLGRFLR